MSDLTQVTSLVFAGGGNRCFWQLGFVSALGNTINPSAIAAVSAGSAMACAYACDRIQETLDGMCAAYEGNEKNFYFGKLLRGQYPFPQEPIYRSAVGGVLKGEAFERLKQGPHLQIGITRPPPMLGGLLGALVGGVALVLSDRFSTKQPMTQEMGYVREWRSVSGCATSEELVDLVIASSCIPPLIRTTRYRGGAVLDGGFIRNVPTFGIPDGPGRMLVLLSQADPQTVAAATSNKDIYVAPSSKLEIAIGDYTNADALRRTFELGKQDGERWLETFRA